MGATLTFITPLPTPVQAPCPSFSWTASLYQATSQLLTIAAAPSTAGKRTVPVVFLDGQFVGGADDLGQMEASGQLRARLGA